MVLISSRREAALDNLLCDRDMLGKRPLAFVGSDSEEAERLVAVERSLRRLPGGTAVRFRAAYSRRKHCMRDWSLTELSHHNAVTIQSQ